MKPLNDLALRRRGTQRASMARTRRRLAARDGLCCSACRWAPPARMGDCGLEAHHLVPVSLGGADDDDNIALLCGNCHAVAHWLEKHDAPLSGLTREAAIRRIATAVSEQPGGTTTAFGLADVAKAFGVSRQWAELICYSFAGRTTPVTHSVTPDPSPAVQANVPSVQLRCARTEGEGLEPPWLFQAAAFRGRQRPTQHNPLGPATPHKRRILDIENPAITRLKPAETASAVTHSVTPISAPRGQA